MKMVRVPYNLSTVCINMPCINFISRITELAYVYIMMTNLSYSTRKVSTWHKFCILLNH